MSDLERKERGEFCDIFHGLRNQYLNGKRMSDFTGLNLRQIRLQVIMNNTANIERLGVLYRKYNFKESIGYAK